MKKHKVLVPVLFILVFFVTFLGCSAFWKVGWWHSSAEGDTNNTTSTSSYTKVDNQSSQQLISVDTTFYNYRYDKEIYDAVRDQGAQSCYDGGVIPFGTFDSKLSAYYKNNKVNVGIYAGNFYMYYGGLEGVGANKLEFPGYYNFRWAANIANRNSPYNSVCQEIVSHDLSGFSVDDTTSGTLKCETSNSGQVNMPYFDDSFLSTKVNNVSIGTSKKNVGFPFRKITSGNKKGYYEFDSTKDVIRFKNMWNQSQDNPTKDEYYFGSDGILQYYYNNYNQFVYTKASDSPQFLPYNQANTQFSDTEVGTSDKQKVIDYGFGVRFNIPFFLSSDGTIDGKNMVFEFSGDDDVWIFLDGKLVLDLGGQHGKATGTIDFGGSGNTIKVTNQTVTYVKNSTNAAGTVTSDKILEEDTYVTSQTKTFTGGNTAGENVIVGFEKGDTHKHVITVFYMERGMFESNFHMAFNFVPEGVPLPEATPVVTPVPVEDNETYQGSLKIQNEVVFPTTTPDTSNNNATESKINEAFIETVKDLAEDDVFQYSIQNQGTDATKVGDSEIRYPSGKLTVRENGATGKKKKSYLSFGAKPVVRIYFNFTSAKNIVSDGDSNVKWGGASKLPCIEISGTHTEMQLYQNEIYYADVQLGSWIKLTNGTSGCSTQPALQISSSYDGMLFTASSLNSNGTLNGTWSNSIYPTSNTGSSDNYSSGLPFQDAGTNAKNFAPANTTSFYPVSDTAYEIKEAYLASTNSNILINSSTTSGITDSNGLFNLFYDDSATFLKQFATGSRMKVVQNDSLMTPVRYTGTLSEALDAATALTKFSAPVTTRKTSDYYYTTVAAECEGVSGTSIVTAPIDITYDGQYYFSNASGISADSKVDIRETFTNTIKIGSLTISKKLKGNMDKDEKHEYGFKVTFSKVFGGTSGVVDYIGSYTLVKENGDTEPGTTNNGIIVLKPDQKAIISGIPVGTKYTIEEVTRSDGSTTTEGSVVSEIETNYVAQAEEDTITSPVYNETKDEAGITVNKDARTISGSIPCSIVNKAYGAETNEFSEVNVSVAFTNQFGALTITKKISGDVNNVSYYGSGDKEYKFIVTDVTDAANTKEYEGEYLVYTYEYKNGPNLPPTVTKDKKNTTDTDGKIVLKEGQMAEIGGIPLDENSKKQYTIKEEIGEDDIYFVESVKVTSGTAGSETQTTSDDTEDNTIIGNDKKKNTTYNTTITTTVFDMDSPTFDVIYTNRYSNAYIEIDKIIDKLYYGDKNYADYTEENKEDISYQELTKAKQSFVFKVKQYENKTDAEAGNDNYESSFDIVVTLGDDKETSTITATSTEKEYFGDATGDVYKNSSEQIKVLANRYYRIEEDTDWSWKYSCKGVRKYEYALNSGSKQIDDSSIEEGTDKFVILRTYLDALNEIEDGKVVPVAEFYNALDSSKADIEGDTDSIPNTIKKQKSN